MTAQIKQWGNSQGIRFSKEILESLNIHVNDVLDVKITDNSIILTKSFQHKTLEERALEFGGKLGPYEEIEWRIPEGREVW